MTKSDQAMDHTEQWGKRLRDLAEAHNFDIEKFCHVPIKPQIKFSQATSWFGGHRFPGPAKLVLASRVISALAGRKVSAL